MRLRLASTTAFWTAETTSFAEAHPTPTVPASSPITTCNRWQRGRDEREF